MPRLPATTAKRIPRTTACPELNLRNDPPSREFWTIADTPLRQATLARERELLATRITELGNQAVGSTPDEFEAFVAADMQKWAKVIRDAGIPLE